MKKEGEIKIGQVVLFVAVGMLLVSMALALDSPIFSSPTPANASIVNDIIINISANDTGTGNISLVLDFNNSMVLWMRFNNETPEDYVQGQNKNESVFDYSIYENNGTAISSPWKTGQVANALEFDGVDERKILNSLNTLKKDNIILKNG